MTVSGAVADAAAGLTVTEAQVTITDNDDRGVTVRPTKLEVTEQRRHGGADESDRGLTVTVSVPAGTDVSAMRTRDVHEHLRPMRRR